MMGKSNRDRARNSQRTRDLVVIGLDEAGRGPLAGPVTAAAVVLAPGSALSEAVTDSKALSEPRRERAYDEVTARAMSYAVVSVDVEEIDRINILQATKRAMERAVLQVLSSLGLAETEASLLIDGNFAINSGCRQESVIGGDATVTAISAASILAKVTRDRLMRDFDAIYPQYGFASHKGYGTRFHRERIREHGPSVIHRRTFAGVREYLSADMP
ncbi:MAG: ribonuclease HII [Bdellovibrionales bacterium]|nr:ribonuclease HII [Bdellovibrionales bacterium]